MTAQRVIVVGGGVLGSMHALSALDRGFEVIQLEREAGPRGASVRNFGLVWVSGRASGPELDLAVRARHRWGAIGERCPATGFRANGSITLARRADELAVLEEAVGAPDAQVRGFTLLTPAEIQVRNPALAGDAIGGLLCTMDAGVEPRMVPGALQALMAATGRYSFHPGREVRSVAPGRVTDHLGTIYEGDLVVLCPGAAHTGLMGEVLETAPLRRVRLQMFETEPLSTTVTTSFADGDSLRYYPAFDLPGLAGLEPQVPIAAEHRIQLLCQQRLDGSLTVGDTHAYDEPFPFDLDERATDYLLDALTAALGTRPPRVVRRWAGVYSQLTETGPDAAIYYRNEIEPGIVIVTGPGGRGMTLSPAIAEETFA